MSIRHRPCANYCVVESMSLGQAGIEAFAQAFIQSTFCPYQVSCAIRAHPKVARKDPATSLLAAGDLHPGRELAGTHVRHPRVKEPAEIIIPILSRKLFLVSAPRSIWFENVTNATEVYCPVFESNRGITDANRLGLVVIGAPGPRQLALGFPLTVPIVESPFRVGVINVLKQNELPIGSVGRETAVRMLRKSGRPIPARHDPDEGRPRPASGELQDLRPGRPATFTDGALGGICREE